MSSGEGAFIYLPVTVGASAEIGPPPGTYQRRVVFRHAVEGANVLVTDDGFVGVTGQGHETAVRIVNAILATALTWGLPSQVVNDPNREFCGFREMASDTIHLGTVNGPSGRNAVSMGRDNEFENWRVYQRFPVTLDQMREIVERATDYLRRPEIMEDLILLAQGWSLMFDQRAAKASFLYHWMIIEAMLDRAWDEYTGSLERTGDERDNLRNTRNWTSYHYAEVLAQVGRMPDAARARLDGLRKVRNEVVHDRRNPSSEEVAACVNTAKRLILNRVQDRGLFEGVT